MLTSPRNGPVLVPHDLTAFSDRALEAAQRLVSAPQLHLVHVLPRIDLATPGVIWPRDEDERRREHALSSLQQRVLGTESAGATLHVRIGEPATRIVELAREIAAALIAMPSHGRSGVQRLLLGSVAEHVVRFAPCPVLVLPASVVGAFAADQPVVPEIDRTPEEQLDAIACEIVEEVEAHSPRRLVAARLAIPPGRDPEWWEHALEQRLAISGVEFVDLVFAPMPHGHAAIQDLRFDR
jgi:nucleotide-binding universal stress UspA family protein